LILFASYREKNQEILRCSYEIPLAVLFCGVLSSFTVFAYMGHLAFELKIDISNLPIGGPELAFVAYPTALMSMPFSNLWSILFFSMMIMLGIDS